MDIKLLFECLNIAEMEILFNLAIEQKLPEDHKEFIPIDKFIFDNKITGRLKTSLIRAQEHNKYIEQITEYDFGRLRNVGRKTVNEFVEIRGY